jgi:2',3'-cyclic-nucleotide 2'-phosphodiesterase (5'-nucleotidase family)
MAGMRRRFVNAALLACGIAAMSSCARTSRTVSPSGPAIASNTVRMLLVNDVYTSDTLRNGRGGLARVAALRDSIERATNSRVLFVLAGDVLSPSVLGKWYAGRQMVDAFNAARLDYAAIGNHEFDLPRAQLLARLEESRFRWMTANCRDATTSAPFPGVRAWDTVSVNGVRIGMFTTTVVAAYSSYVRCTHPDSSTSPLIDSLRGAGADLVIGLTHRYIHEDSATMANEPRLDAILGGHEHDGRRIVFGNRLLIKAHSNVRTAALVTFERVGNEWRMRDTLIEIGPGMREDSATRVVVSRWSDSLVKRIGPDQVIGVSSEPINAVDSTSRRGESRFGNMIADGMRRGTNADVAMVNSGALRFDDIMAAGPITSHMIEAIFLFADETRALTFPLTGARLRALLENGVGRGRLGAGGYPQVSGVRFSLDPRRETGSRIVGDLTRDNGTVIRPTDTLRVTFVAYPACKGGDGYQVPEAAAVCAEVDRNPTSAPRTVDLVLAHLRAMNGNIVQPPVGRVTRVDRQ